MWSYGLSLPALHPRGPLDGLYPSPKGPYISQVVLLDATLSSWVLPLSFGLRVETIPPLSLPPGYYVPTVVSCLIPSPPEEMISYNCVGEGSG